MTTPLSRLIPFGEKPDAGTLLDRFLSYVDSKGLTLYPSQENAILELFENRNVILNTPTGSGKSLVAMAGHFKALADGRRSVYTCPIKALVNEKWMTLCREFGPELVGLSTGDATVNRDAPILCCTAEILSNIALREGACANVQEVIMDEFHFYADRDRGVAWQIPLLTLPQARFLLMSATLGDTTFFEEEITRLTATPTVSITSVDRPVPLSFEYADTMIAATLERLVQEGKGPVYVVHFTQLEAAQNAQSFTSLDVCSRTEKDALAAALSGFRFSSPYGPEIKRLLRQGIGLHHAGLLPKYRILVEQLAQKGLLKVICGTDTLGVGINVPIRTVLFTRLCKYDGQKTAILSARDFHQISGRAGRKGYDDKGWVVAQAPEYVIENLQLEQKRVQSGKKVTKRKPPDKNFVNWDKSTFERLIAAKPERLVSRFQVTHAMLINMLSRTGDGCTAIRSLIASCHDTAKQKQSHINRAWQLFRSLVNRNIVEFIPHTDSGATVRVNVDLQEDFSMNQALSLYLIETIPLLDAQAPDYPMRLLTLVESILENPDAILRKQLDKIKTKKMAEMKMDGIPFEERIEELDKLEYPKPDRDFVYNSFNDFTDRHPWVGQDNIRPKSIAREMFESFRSFADYVRDFELQRSEGLLLRHLNSVYDVLSKSVPENYKTEPLFEMELYLDTMIRQVDSSLLDEWEKMRNPSYMAAETKEVRPPGADSTPDITRDTKGFTAKIRTRIFAFLRALSIGEYAEALEALGGTAGSSGTLPAAVDGPEPWSAERLGTAHDAFRAGHDTIRLDPEARNIRHTYVTPSEDGRTWNVQQMVIDPDEHNDWTAVFEIDLIQSRTAGEPIISLRGFYAIDNPEGN